MLKLKSTKTEISSVGTLNFYGENFFSVKLNISREKDLNQLVDELIDRKKISQPERRIMSRNILDKALKMRSKDLTLYFFNPMPKDKRGSSLLEIESLYKEFNLKGDPVAMVCLDLLDEDFSFVKKIPHMSLFKNEGDAFCFSSFFSKIPSIEGFNITATSVRRQSGYFPSKFWFCGVINEIK